jgi:hypothetical protein
MSSSLSGHLQNLNDVESDGYLENVRHRSIGGRRGAKPRHLEEKREAISSLFGFMPFSGKISHKNDEIPDKTIFEDDKYDGYFSEKGSASNLI